ncbi:MAG: hypothetical protein WC827_03835 [Candidatus Paceibacterota bacterium]|jgi:hypothetical protein
MEDRQIKSFKIFFFTLDSAYLLVQYLTFQKEPLYTEIRKTLKKAMNYLKRKNPRIEHIHVLIKELTLQLEEHKKLANEKENT